jgi:hypothetical protein
MKYNPFKMWGSWIGALVLYLYLTVNIFQEPVGITYPWELLECCFRKCSFGLFPVDCKFHIIITGIPVIIGFLLGWGIHSLIRKLKSKNNN